MHSWANKSYCLSLEGEETQFSGTDICPAAETQMTMTPELCVSALQANIIPFAMEYGNGGMDELKKLLLREGDAMKIMALYHCQETSPLKVVMEYATIACVASKTYSDIFKALHTEALFYDKLFLDPGYHMENLYNAKYATKNKSHTKMDFTATQWEVVACALRSKFDADSNVDEYLLSVLEANLSCQCTVGAEVLAKSGPGYEKVTRICSKINESKWVIKEAGTDELLVDKAGMFTSDICGIVR